MISVFKKIYQGFRSPHLALGYAMDKYQCSVDKKIHIPYLVVITGQKCTLRCKDCGNFTPYLPQTHYNINDLCDDINKFSSVARITLLQIQGGEALIFPMFKELLNIVGGAARFVTIATNGTRLLSEEQITAVKAAKASLRISDYGLIFLQKADKLMAQCKENHIDCNMYKFAVGTGNWIDLGDKDTVKNCNIDVHNIFKSCPFKTCLTLENGIIGRCSRATVVHHIQKFIPKENDFVVLRNLNIKDLHEQLLQYVLHPTPMEACRFCRGGRGRLIPPAIQITTQ